MLMVEAGPDVQPGAMPAAIASPYPGRAYFNADWTWPGLQAAMDSDGSNAGRTVRPYEQARLVGGGSSINGLGANRGRRVIFGSLKSGALQDVRDWDGSPGRAGPELGGRPRWGADTKDCMMSDMPLRRIRAVTARPGYRVAISWDRGAPAIVDLSTTVSLGGVFTALADKDVFARVQIGENKWTIEWPAPADEYGHPIIAIDAEALFRMAEDQQLAGSGVNMRKMIESARQITRAASPSKTVTH